MCKWRSKRITKSMNGLLVIGRLYIYFWLVIGRWELQYLLLRMKARCLPLFDTFWSFGWTYLVNLNKLYTFSYTGITYRFSWKYSEIRSTTSSWNSNLFALHGATCHTKYKHVKIIYDLGNVFKTVK